MDKWTCYNLCRMRLESFGLNEELLHYISKNHGVGKDSWESLGLQQDQVNPKGNQPWIFIRRTDAEAENPVIWPLDEKSHSLGKTLMLGKIEHKRRRGQQRMRWLDSITKSRDRNLSKLWEMVEDRGAWQAAVHVVTKSQIWLSDWTTTTLARSIVLLSLFKSC